LFSIITYSRITVCTSSVAAILEKKQIDLILTVSPAAENGESDSTDSKIRIALSACLTDHRTAYYKTSFSCDTYYISRLIMTIISYRCSTDSIPRRHAEQQA
jgi:hypothetical protein